MRLQPRDRRVVPSSLRVLLRWAYQAYVDETPNLDHSGVHLDDDGAPTMARAARRYLGLVGVPDERDDDWVRIASRLDQDGYYLTPLRRAIETLPPPRRLFLRDLVPEALFPTEVALLHGIPAWCVQDVIRQSLTMLWRGFLDRPLSAPGYLERSEAQRAAEGACVDGVA